MSEAMSSGDIEDVLSSIRRLVSDDFRPSKFAEQKPKAVPPVGTDKVPPVVAGKLLLTPALRVVSSKVDSPAPTASAPPVDAAVKEDALPEQEAPYIFVEDEEFGQVVDFASDAASPAANQQPDIRFRDRAAFDDTPADVDEDWLPERSDSADYSSTHRPKSKGDVPDLTRVVSDIAAGFSDAEEANWESETGDSSVSEDQWQVPAWGIAAEDQIDSTEVAADLAEDAAVAEILARAQRETPAHDADEASQAPDVELESGFNAGLDQAVLRDMVRELIREELSGTLGERITRNVRKLVRAEIGRALTSRGIE